MMRFTTASGTSYGLTDIVEIEKLPGFSEGLLVRDGVPLTDVTTGDGMDELYGQRVLYATPPALGERFVYVTESHGQCSSTPVVSFEPEPLPDGVGYPGDVEAWVHTDAIGDR